MGFYLSIYCKRMPSTIYPVKSPYRKKITNNVKNDARKNRIAKKFAGRLCLFGTDFWRGRVG